MKKHLVLVLACACGAATAQTIGQHPMPDGSSDMYLGLGAQSMPRYEGAARRRVAALPVLQFEWSNGVFVAGMSAGMHLSGQPSMEYGPLLAIQPRRSDSGSAAGAGSVDEIVVHGIVGGGGPGGPPVPPPGATLLWGMRDIGARLEYGAFFNYYLTPRLRLTNSLLYGAGNARTGARWNVGLQHTAIALAAHHTLALSVGATLANRSYNQAFFGVSETDSAMSVNPEYQAAAGLKDVQAGARWSWAFSPAWMMTSALQVARLAASAKDSPLVERPTNLTVSTALAYRF